MNALKTLVAAAGFAVIGAAAAGAVEVRQVAEIKAAPADVWAKVGGWCAIKDWHPAIAGCDASKKGYRTLTLKDGGRIVEKLTKTGKNTYSYAIVDGPLPVKNYNATLTAKADSLGSTDLTWTAKFDAKGKTESEAAAVINGIFEAGLKNIKDNVKIDAAPATGVAAAPPASAAVAAKDDARLKAREARAKKFEELKLKALEKIAQEKAEFAKLREQLLEKAKSAAAAAKAEYEKAKAAFEKAAAAPAPAAADKK